MLDLLGEGTWTDGRIHIVLEDGYEMNVIGESLIMYMKAPEANRTFWHDTMGSSFKIIFGSCNMFMFNVPSA